MGRLVVKSLAHSRSHRVRRQGCLGSAESKLLLHRPRRCIRPLHLLRRLDLRPSNCSEQPIPIMQPHRRTRTGSPANLSTTKHLRVPTSAMRLTRPKGTQLTPHAYREATCQSVSLTAALCTTCRAAQQLPSWRITQDCAAEPSRGGAACAARASAAGTDDVFVEAGRNRV